MTVKVVLHTLKGGGEGPVFPRVFKNVHGQILKYYKPLIAERLSVRQLIVQCGLKSQLAYIYIYIYIYIYMCATSVTLRNAIKSPVTFLIRVITMSVRSVYVLLLQL